MKGCYQKCFNRKIPASGRFVEQISALCFDQEKGGWFGGGVGEILSGYAGSFVVVNGNYIT